MQEDNHSSGAIVKEITITDAVEWIKAAWQLVTPETIRNCWRKAGFRDSLKYFDTETLISGTMSSKHLNEFCRNMDEMMLRQTIARHKEKQISDYFTLV